MKRRDTTERSLGKDDTRGVMRPHPAAHYHVWDAHHFDDVHHNTPTTTAHARDFNAGANALSSRICGVRSVPNPNQARFLMDRSPLSIAKYCGNHDKNEKIDHEMQPWKFKVLKAHTHMHSRVYYEAAPPCWKGNSHRCTLARPCSSACG